MGFETLRHDLDDGILQVTLDRPDHLNAFSVTMADELEQTFHEVSTDDRVRAVIVTGSPWRSTTAANPSSPPSTEQPSASARL